MTDHNKLRILLVELTELCVEDCQTVLPRIRAAIDAGEVDGVPYLAYELVAEAGATALALMAAFGAGWWVS